MTTNSKPLPTSAEQEGDERLPDLVRELAGEAGEDQT